MRILIIEDEKLLADSLKALLEQNGFEADAACDGKTGEYYAALGINDLLIPVSYTHLTLPTTPYE